MDLTKLFLFSFIVSLLSQASTQTQAIELIDDNFFDYIKQHKNVAVLFYQTKCPECIEIEADIQALIQEKHATHPHWTFAKFNLHKYHHFSKVLHVHQFPRLRFYFDNEFHSTLHTHPSKSDVHAFFTQLSITPPKPHYIKTQADIDLFNETKLAIYLAFPDYTDQNRYFSDMLQVTFPEIPVYISLAGSKIDKELFDQSKPVFRFLLKRVFDDGNRETTSHALFNVQTVLNIINTFQHERIQLLNPENFDKIMSHRHSFIVILDHDHSSINIETAKNVLLQKHYTGLIIISNLNESEIGHKLGVTLGISSQDFPMLIVVRNYDKRFQKYKHSGDFSEQGLEKFMSQFFDDKIPEYMRSQPELPFNAKKVELVGSNFDDFINKSKSHIIVLFYKENDHASYVFKKSLNELFKNLSIENNITYAQTNAELNDYKHVFSRSLPHLYLYKLDQKEEPVQFSGSPMIEDLFKFLGDQLQEYIHRVPPHLVIQEEL